MKLKYSIVFSEEDSMEDWVTLLDLLELIELWLTDYGNYAI